MDTVSYTITRGQKRYELSNHLGNVLAVVSDKTKSVCLADTVQYFTAEVLFGYDYSPFGAILPERVWGVSDCDKGKRVFTFEPDTLADCFALTIANDMGEFREGFCILGSSLGSSVGGPQVASFSDGLDYLVDYFNSVDGFNASRTGNTLIIETDLCVIDSSFLHYEYDYFEGGHTLGASTVTIPGVKSDYRFGFNGKEKDNEVSGIGNVYDYGFRIYNPRLGRFLSVDPLTKGYSMLTPYQFASNTPIQAIDIDGLEAFCETAGWGYEEQGAKVGLTHEEYIKMRQKEGASVLIGIAVVADMVLTKGRFTVAVGIGGLFEHNTAKTPTGIEAQKQRQQENILNLFLAFGVQKIFGLGAKVVAPVVKKLYNFGSKALGEMGEEALARQYGVVKPGGKGNTVIKTTIGGRKPDGIPVGETVHSTDQLFEAKVGLQQYSGNIVEQVAKDAELLATGQVKEITWVFYRSPNTGKVGASQGLLDALEKAGIKTQIAGDIPTDIIEKTAKKYGTTTK